MLSCVRAGFAAALLAFAALPAFAADKAFQRDDLDDAAIKLEAQIKSDAGTVTKPAAQLRREADAAFDKNDFRTGMVVLGQIVAAAPNDSANWLRLARTVLQIRPRNDRERALLLDRAATAAYIAYQRTQNRSEEADSLVVLGRSSPTARSGAARSMRCGSRSKCARSPMCARNTNGCARSTASACSITRSIRTPRRRAPASSSPRNCPASAPTSRRSSPSPAWTSRRCRPNDKQLCVEGLKHGERYTITLRAGLPSTVQETLAKSAEFTIYVRDRKPFVRFTGKAYVLPRTGQRGIPVVSVNTTAVAIEIYRIGDRNLIDTVLGRDFQRNLDRYEAKDLTESRGSKVWNGELAVEQTLNTDVTTAFPVDQAVGALAPGVYVMTAAAKGNLSEDYDQLATQWFIVSDLGLTAYSGNDGIHVFVHSLASAEPKAQIEVRLMSRSNEVLATKRTDATGLVHFEAGLTRGEGGLAPAALIATETGDYAFLSLKGRPSISPTAASPAGQCRPGSMPSSIPSAASIAPARPCT